MSDTIVAYLLPLAFALLIACALTSIVCGAILLLFKLRRTNAEFRHPYLKTQAWDRYPVSIRASILLDYFFRLAWPKSRFWIVGDANRLLAHVHPDDVPSTLKWPIIGLWGGCLIGSVAMLLVWALILIKMNF